MAGLVAMHYRNDVTESTSLVDHSTTTRIGDRSGNEGLCASSTLMGDVFEQDLALPHKILLGTLDAGKCQRCRVLEALSADPVQTGAAYMWSPLENRSVCGDQRDVQAYCGTLDRVLVKLGRSALPKLTHARLKTMSFGAVDILGEVAGDQKYEGAVLKDDTVVFAPHSADNIGLINTTDKTFQAIDISAEVSGHAKYGGAVLKDDTVVFAPHDADSIGLINTTAKTFQAIDISAEVSGHAKYLGAVLKDDTVVFAPHDADSIGLINTTAKTFQAIDISAEVSGHAKYRGRQLPGFRSCVAVVAESDSMTEMEHLRRGN